MKEKHPGSTYAKVIKEAENVVIAKSPSITEKTSDVYARTVQDLESKWYDVKGFWREYQTPWALEHGQKRLNLFELYFAGKLTEAERQTREAALLKEYVTKYTKPLPPVEWKHRYDGYAKEEEAKRAKQMEELHKSIPENERLLREAREKAKQK